MRPLELLLNGQLADLPASTKGLVKLSQARASLADVSARVGEYSFPLTLPATRRNQLIFGVDKLHPQGLGKFGYFIDYAYELRVGGQVFAGTFRLTSLKNGYVGSLIGAGLSWALLLGDTKLTDLKFAALPYDGSQLAGILALDCDSTDVQFPLVAFGNFYHPPLLVPQSDGTTSEQPCPPAAVLDYPLSVDDYPPGVYYGNVLRQIFKSIGWQLQGRELDSEFWRAVVLTCAGADLDAAWPWGSLLPATGTAPAGGQAFSYYGQGPHGGYSNSAAGFYTLPGDGPELGGDCYFLPVPLTQAPLRPTRTLELGTATYTALRPGVYDFDWSATLASAQEYFGGDNIDQHDPFVRQLLQPVGLGLVVRRGGQDFSEGEGGLLRGNPNQAPLDYAAGQDRVLTPQRLDVFGPLGSLRLGSYQGAAPGVYLETGDSVTLCLFARRCVLDGQGKVLGYRSQAFYNFSAAALRCTRYADNDGLSLRALQPAAFLPPLACKDVVKNFLLSIDGFLLADASRKVATLVSRAELTAAGGEALDLSDLCDPLATEYLPAAGAGVGSFVFAPVALEDDALVPATADIVTAPVGPGDTAQSISSVFAPVGFRSVWLTRGAYVALPTCSTKDILAQNRSETQPDSKSQAPRLVRYTGPDPVQVINFGQGTLPLAGAVWDGPLAWDGAGGAVATYYQSTIKRALRGHLARVQVPLSPALYQGLAPGRRVLLHGAPYTVEAVSNYDPSDEAGLALVDLSREVL